MLGGAKIAQAAFLLSSSCNNREKILLKKKHIWASVFVVFRPLILSPLFKPADRISISMSEQIDAPHKTILARQLAFRQGLSDDLGSKRINYTEHSFRSSGEMCEKMVSFKKNHSVKPPLPLLELPGNGLVNWMWPRQLCEDLWLCKMEKCGARKANWPLKCTLKHLPLLHLGKIVRNRRNQTEKLDFVDDRFVIAGFGRPDRFLIRPSEIDQDNSHSSSC